MRSETACTLIPFTFIRKNNTPGSISPADGCPSARRRAGSCPWWSPPRGRRESRTSTSRCRDGRRRRGRWRSPARPSSTAARCIRRTGRGSRSGARPRRNRSAAGRRRRRRTAGRGGRRCRSRRLAASLGNASIAASTPRMLNGSCSSPSGMRVRKRRQQRCVDARRLGEVAAAVQHAVADRDDVVVELLLAEPAQDRLHRGAVVGGALARIEGELDLRARGALGGERRAGRRALPPVPRASSSKLAAARKAKIGEFHRRRAGVDGENDLTHAFTPRPRDAAAGRPSRVGWNAPASPTRQRLRLS